MKISDMPRPERELRYREFMEICERNGVLVSEASESSLKREFGIEPQTEEGGAKEQNSPSMRVYAAGGDDWQPSGSHVPSEWD